MVLLNPPQTAEANVVSQKAITGNQFKSVLPFPRKPIRQFNLAFLIHSITAAQHVDVQFTSCGEGQVKTLGGVAGTNKAIDQREAERQGGVRERNTGKRGSMINP